LAPSEHAAIYGWNRVENDFATLLDNPEIDIIDITSPNNQHAEMAIAACNAGKAVLCEKPLAMNVAEAQAVVAAAKKNKTINMVCHNYRRAPAIAFAKQMIENGDLGDRFFHFRARYAQDWIVDPEFPLVWRLQKSVAGSGSHGDLAAHLIDVAHYLIGGMKEVCGMMETFVKDRPVLAEVKAGLSATAGTKRGKVTVDDAVSFIGRFKNGAVGNIEATRFATGHKNGMEFEINGNKGSIMFAFEDMNRLKYFSANDPAGKQGFRDILVSEGGSHPYWKAWWPPGHIIGYEHTFIHTVADLITNVCEGRNTHPTFSDGLECQKVLDAVDESVKTRGWVKV
jgi:predicted dehydrogenase